MLECIHASRLPKGLLLLNLLLILSPFASRPAFAASFGFECITLNVASDCAIGAGQLELDVTDAGSGQVSFKFSNLDPPGAQATIQAVYWDDLFDVNFSADADDPAPTNGVNPNEMLEMIFDLSGGVSFADVLADISGDPLDQDSLRIGIHVTNFASGGSESFIATPEPASVSLVALGLLGLARARRRRS